MQFSFISDFINNGQLAKQNTKYKILEMFDNT